MASDGTPTVRFRSGDLLPDLAARSRDTSDSAISETADRDLHRYYALLKRSLPTFTEAEASLLADAMNGLMLEPHSAHLLWANIDDAVREGLAEKWGVDGSALVARLRALTPFEALAVHEALEVAWHDPRHRDDLGAVLRAVGLVR